MKQDPKEVASQQKSENTQEKKIGVGYYPTELETTAEKYANLSHEDFDGNIDLHFYKAFILGANWQSKQTQQKSENEIELWEEVLQKVQFNMTSMSTNGMAKSLSNFFTIRRK